MDQRKVEILVTIEKVTKLGRRAVEVTQWKAKRPDGTMLRFRGHWQGWMPEPLGPGRSTT
jgi:hypothetical protein